MHHQAHNQDRSPQGLSGQLPPPPPGRSRDEILGQAAFRQGTVPGTAEPDSAGTENVTDQVQQQLTQLAQNKDDFHSLMRQAFGESYDYQKAESIRQHTVAGDFAWMPKITVLNAAAMGPGIGAYSQKHDQIYLSAELLVNDPDLAAKVLMEELGHALDARLNSSDSTGDEGELFARMASGETLTQVDITTIRAEDDTGTILVDGESVQIEFFLSDLGDAISSGLSSLGDTISSGLSRLGEAVSGFVDGVTDFVGDLGRALVDGVTNIWESTWELVETVINSEAFQYLTAVAQFIPVLAPFTTMARMATGAYTAYQGFKHGSMSMVLQGGSSHDIYWPHRRR